MNIWMLKTLHSLNIITSQRDATATSPLKANGRVVGMGDLGYYDSQTLLMAAAKSHQDHLRGLMWTFGPRTGDENAATSHRSKVRVRSQGVQRSVSDDVKYVKLGI